MTSPALSDRTRRILAALIREYIETGEPVASAALTRRTGLAVSSATIRNVLAQLEELGFVWQPHTSAGRVPTDLGYRFYVDLLLEARRATKDAAGVEARLRQQAGDAPLIDDLLSSASHVLSEVSRHVGFAIAPANAEAVFHRIEFVPLSRNRILVVMVARGNQVSQKTIDIGEEVEPSELVRAANYLNEQFCGQTLDQVREGCSRACAKSERCTINCWGWHYGWPAARSKISSGRRSASMARRHCSRRSFGQAAYRCQRCGRCSSMVEEKQRLVRMLNEYIDGPGLTVVIGAEHSDPELRPFSLIASTYFDGRSTGMVGVIGPTRMRYSRAIDVVENAAKAMGKVLRDN